MSSFNRCIASFASATFLLSLLLAFPGCGRAPSATNATSGNATPLMIYCAAGIRLPVEEIAKKYEARFDRPVQIDYGSSGELEGRLEIDRRSGKSRCDVYIPADVSFATRTQQKGLTVESMDLASFRLVLAVKPNSGLQFASVDELLAGDHKYVVCDTKAGVGKKTKTTLAKFDKWQAIDENKKASFPRVPEAANAIKTSSDIAAGFIWDTTAVQFGLVPIVPAELKDAASTVTANVSALSKRPTDALHFCRYLASADQGRPAFEKHGFESAATDQWHEKPELVLYCGGVNRNAIDKTLRDFESREGVVIREQYAGCGTLVTGINSIGNGDSQKGMPDAFMTCDVSYMTKVQNFFDTPADVSSTRIVLLVRKGNPKGIRTIADLAKDDISIGTTNPRMSTLGDLSWQLFEDEGIKPTLEEKKSVIVMTPTAHELIMQMTGHGKLDVALVYEANCQQLSEEFEVVPVEEDGALAVQNIATARDTPYPALSSRLTKAIRSEVSRKRFEVQGFTWRVQPTP